MAPMDLAGAGNVFPSEETWLNEEQHNLTGLLNNGRKYSVIVVSVFGVLDP